MNYTIEKKEIKYVFVTIIFGIALWLIYAGFRQWLSETFKMPNLMMMGIGVVVLFISLYFIKFRPSMLKLHRKKYPIRKRKKKIRK